MQGLVLDKNKFQMLMASAPAGGSRNTGSSVLSRLHALAEAEAELATHQHALDAALAAQKQTGAAAGQHKKYALPCGLV
jgi:hypothetical protein